MAGRSGITVRVEGLEELRRRLEDLPDHIKQALRRAIRDASTEIREDTRSRVRIDTGNLWRSVRVEFLDGGLNARVGWLESGSHYAKYHEFGTKRITAKPALGPAVAAERARFVNRIAGEVRQSLRSNR